MINVSKDASKALVGVFTLLALIALIFIAKHFYDADKKVEVLSGVNTATQTTENKAIEKAQQINQTVSGLSDDDIDSGLQSDYRDDSEPQQRVQVIQSDQAQPTGYEGNKTPSTEPQQTVPPALPRASPKIPFYGLDCQVRYGFDENDKVAAFETCKHAR